ncbi:MAG: acetyl-CoA carboxylase biotin carboxyl carrier protein [Bacteroidetes bacterium]|nr:acetyl-CoA carboxylase biotin carboxyl carrier protein [Bacteroidota bacterium]MCZ6758512.1 acetyl-CoA carboxylase biotin carboxyl carrier protein [Bacteroidota bacterium]
MDLERLREIIHIVEETGVAEIEIEQDGLRIVVRASSSGVAQHIVTSVPSNSSPAPVVDESGSSAPASSTAVEVRAPIVGTFYLSSSPDSAPFVEVGDHVNPGDVLCIIEAMKLMNEIEAEVSGTVMEVLVENANPIEFDQPLFIIEPS